MKFKNSESIYKTGGWSKLALAVAAAILIFSGVSYYAVNSWYQDNLSPITSEAVDDIVVVIDSGSSVRSIGDQLKELGVIKNSTVFSWYVGRQNPQPSLLAGTYKLNPSQSVSEIVEILGNGDVATSLYTVLPGLRLDELRQDFIDFGFSESEVDEALSASYRDHPLLRDLPTGLTLEGYIFPETYQVTNETTVSDIIEKSFDEMYDRLSSDILAKLERENLNIHQAITLASIVEQESLLKEDQPKIAQVFLSRLDSGIILGSDVTFIYAAEITSQEPAVDLDHPYNTRLYGGLPPGPISNFNFSALEAVANPSDTDYLYFVAGDNGTTYFSKTLEEHEALTAKYCIKLCEL